MDIKAMYVRFPTQAHCIALLEGIRWRGVPVCPYCASTRSTPLREEHRYHCNACNTTYSVTVKTIFHHTHLPLQKWFLGVSLILNAKQRITARQLAEALEINRNTAWYVAMRVRQSLTASPEQRALLQNIMNSDPLG